MNILVKLAIKKAQQSDCRYKVSAIGFNRKGGFLGIACNKHKINKQGCSYHAEVELIKKFARRIKTIVICRTNHHGTLLPIHPCAACSKLANKYGIEIKTILEIL